MPGYLLNKKDRLACAVSRNVIRFSEGIRIGRPVIVFSKRINSFLCDIPNRLNVAEHCHRVAVAAERIYGKRRINQRVGTCKGIILGSGKYMVIPDT